jgi:hypothetical protein
MFGGFSVSGDMLRRRAPGRLGCFGQILCLGHGQPTLAVGVFDEIMDAPILVLFFEHRGDRPAAYNHAIFRAKQLRKASNGTRSALSQVLINSLIYANSRRPGPAGEPPGFA